MRHGFLFIFFLSIVSHYVVASVQSERFLFEYRVSIEPPKLGSNLRLWVPQPREHIYQRIEDKKIESSLPWKITQEKKYGNRMIYMEGKAEVKKVDATFSYIISRTLSRGIQKNEIEKTSYDRPELFLKQEKRVPFVPLFRDIAAKETASDQSEGEKIRKLYNYIVRTMSYDKSGKGWGNGDAIWACSTKRGNCTDFHSLFIGLARVIDIPARFIIGFPIDKDRAEGEVPGYHCWAEAYSSSTGWIPMDASEGKKSGSPDAYYGQLPSDRVEFTMGRDLVLAPKQKGEPLNYFIYPYAEIDEKMFTEIKKQFRFRKLKESEDAKALLHSVTKRGVI